MRVKPIFRWYDMWVGVFVHRKEREVFVFYFPMLGFKISWGEK
jgi:hypothetical protein